MSASIPPSDQWLQTIENEIILQIHRYMEREKINQTQLAQRLGVSKGRVSQILSGKLNFSMRTLVELCAKMEVMPILSFHAEEK